MFRKSVGLWMRSVRLSCGSRLEGEKQVLTGDGGYEQPGLINSRGADAVSH